MMINQVNRTLEIKIHGFFFNFYYFFLILFIFDNFLRLRQMNFFITISNKNHIHNSYYFF